MANAAALIQESLWRRDKEFRALPRLAQCAFLQLLSTKDVDCAGVLTLNVDILAKGCHELTVEAFWHDLKTLEEARFIFVDQDTDELLIRSYLRLVSVRSPNAYKSALKAARLVDSPKLRQELALELRRLDRADATAVANEITPAETPSRSHPDPIQIPSERDIPSESHSKPPVSVPVQYQYSPSVDGCFREEPPPFCHRHMPNGTNAPCGACRQAREQHETWKAGQASAAAELNAAFWREVIACPDCDERGWIESDEDGFGRCPNHDWSVTHA